MAFLWPGTLVVALAATTTTKTIPKTNTPLSYITIQKQVQQNPNVYNPQSPTQKPCNSMNKLEPNAHKVRFSSVYATPVRPTFKRPWSSTDLGRLAIFTAVHMFGLLAPLRYFSTSNLAAAFLIYVTTGVGVTFSYHRQLAHRSFKSPKWLEYFAAYCGAMAFQGAPMEWVSDHRYHHLHTETPLDPHSSYEGFWWSHMGWMLDSDAYLARCEDRSNVADLAKQPFYSHMQKHYLLHCAAHFGLCFFIGGFPFFCWRMAGIALLYHVTWLVNSAAHLWGQQEWRTEDQSRNNWWVGFLAFGEGWHNNHHAFEYSARHGLGPRQFDLTWILISTLQRIGLVSGVKLPSESAKARLSMK